MARIYRTETKEMEKMVIAVAITGGSRTKQQNPNLPEQPDEQVDALYEAMKAGASIGHLHVRDKNGEPTIDLRAYEELIGKAREKCGDMILQVGNGPAVRKVGSKLTISSLPERMALLNLDPKPDMLTINAGTLEAGREWVFPNPHEWNKEFVRGCQERDIDNEFVVYDVSQIYNVLDLANRGFLEVPLHFNLVLGVPGGVPGMPEYLLEMIHAIPNDSIWQITCLDNSHLLVTLGMLFGGHIRTGLEDTLYYSPGVLAESNAQLVSRWVRVAKELGREVATPREARDILRLKKR